MKTSHFFTLLTLSLFANSFTPNAFGACSDHNPMDASVPTCPANGNTLLGENYPVMAVSLSEPAIEYLTDDAVKKYVENQALSILKAQPNKPPQLIIQVSEKTKQNILKKINEQNISPSLKQKWIASITFVENGTPYSWQQDVFESFADPKTGRPVIRSTGYDKVSDLHTLDRLAVGISEMRIRVNTFQDFNKGIPSSCNIQQKPALKKSDYYRSGYDGGNLESFFGHCVIGSDHFSKESREDYVKQFCGSNDNVIVAPTSDLVLGHVDEIYKMIPLNQPPPCNYAIILPSPTKALELMRKNPQAKAFDFPTGINDNGKAGMMTSPGYHDICKSFLDNQGQPNRPQDSHRGNSLLMLSIPPAMALDTPGEWLNQRQNTDRNHPEMSMVQFKDSDRDQVVYSAIGYDDALKCANMTNADMLRTIERSDFKDIQEKFGASLQEFKSQMLDLGESKYGCKKSDAKIIEMPMLYNGELGYSYTENYTDRTRYRTADHVSDKYKQKNQIELAGHSVTTIYPNPVNGEYFNGTLIMSDPSNNVFRDYVSSSLKQAGVKADFISNQWAHAHDGNTHCTMHAMRYCRPSGAKGSVK